MTLRPALIVTSAAALALAACGYAGEDEPHESGANRLPEAEPPVSARETSPDSPQAGDTEADAPERELAGPATAGEESGEEEPAEGDPHSGHEHEAGSGETEPGP